LTTTDVLARIFPSWSDCRFKLGWCGRHLCWDPGKRQGRFFSYT